MIKIRAWWLSKKWGYAASVALVPYTVLKTLWAQGATVLVSDRGIEELHVSMSTVADPMSRFLYTYGIDMTAVFALIASLLGLSLVQNWGRKVPRWMVLFPSCAGGLIFIYISVVTFSRLIAGNIDFSANPEFNPWVLLPVYGGFLTWGATISLAALSYCIRTGRSKTIAQPQGYHLKEDDLV